MKHMGIIAAALVIASGCASPRAVIERQTRAVGERAEQAVAAKFPEMPRDSLRWAEVFWYCTRDSETNPPVIRPTATVDVLDVRTLRPDSYSFPKVKRFRVEMDADRRTLSVERDTDGLLNIQSGSDEGASNKASEDIDAGAPNPQR